MLVAALVSALTTTAAAPVKPWACELAPAFGTGTADEGRVDQFTALNFSCRYRLFGFAGVDLYPVLGLDKQLWSIRDSHQGQRDLSTFETQDLVYGLRLQTPIWQKVSAFYSVQGAQGRGTLSQTFSTADSSLDREVRGVKNQHVQHSLGLAYQIGRSFSVSAAWQRQDGSQSWDANSGSLTLQQGSGTGALTLTEGGAGYALTGIEAKSSSSHSSNLFQLGVSLSFGER